MFSVNEAKKLQIQATVDKGGLFYLYSRLVRGALCRYANSARLTGFYRTKNSLNEERAFVYVHGCVRVLQHVQKGKESSNSLKGDKKNL